MNHDHVIYEHSLQPVQAILFVRVRHPSPSHYRYIRYTYFVFHLGEHYSALRFLRSQGFLSTTSINRLGDINIGVTDTVRGYSIIYFIWLLYL